MSQSEEEYELDLLYSRIRRAKEKIKDAKTFIGINNPQSNPKITNMLDQAVEILDEKE